MCTYLLGRIALGRPT